MGLCCRNTPITANARRGEQVFEADNLDDHNIVCDFAAVKEVTKGVVQTFDNVLCINTDDPMYDTLKQVC